MVVHYVWIEAFGYDGAKTRALLNQKRRPGDPSPCVTFRLVVAPLRGPGQSPVLPFACCVGLPLSHPPPPPQAKPPTHPNPKTLSCARCACRATTPSVTGDQGAGAAQFAGQSPSAMGLCLLLCEGPREAVRGAGECSSGPDDTWPPLGTHDCVPIKMPHPMGTGLEV